MINILNEEPVSILPDKEIENFPDFIQSYVDRQKVSVDKFWIFKNPTSSEVSELCSSFDDIRILIEDKNNYYIASCELYTHRDMARCLNEYNGLTYRDYLEYFMIEGYTNNIRTGDTSCERELVAYDTLKHLIPEMLRVGLIKENTEIMSYYDEDLNGITMKDLLDSGIKS